jgi:hypothetical protein
MFGRADRRGFGHTPYPDPPIAPTPRIAELRKADHDPFCFGERDADALDPRRFTPPPGDCGLAESEPEKATLGEDEGGGPEASPELGLCEMGPGLCETERRGLAADEGEEGEGEDVRLVREGRSVGFSSSSFSE